MNRTLVALTLVLLVCGVLMRAATPAPPPPPGPAAKAAEKKSTFKVADPSTLSAANGWIDLVTDPKLSDWQRVPLSATKGLDVRNPWNFDRGTGILSGDGTGLHEMLLHSKPRSDGVFWVEWRFPGKVAKPNSGIFVRTKLDNSSWFQAELSPGTVGTLSGSVPGADGKPRRISLGARRPDLLRKGDAWNVVEITCLGSRIMLRINGVITVDWSECRVQLAHLGVETDGSPVEFRTLKFKPLP